MRVGATISPTNMQIIRQSIDSMRVSPKYSLPITDSHFRAPAKAQMETALLRYRNDGTPYNFYADRCAGPGCGKSREDLGEDGRLQKCGRCKEVFYCGSVCQGADWEGHKKGCRTPEKKAEMEARRQARSGRGIRCLNV